MPRTDVARWRDNLRGEIDGAHVYRGAAITVMTGKNALQSGLRQVGFGLAAAAVTYGIGTLLGTAVG